RRDAQVASIEIHPQAVMESVGILDRTPYASAVQGDLRDAAAILRSPAVRRLLDFRQPVGLLIVSVLHFVPEDGPAYDAVAHLVGALPSGSYLALSHAASEAFDHLCQQAANKADV